MNNNRNNNNNRRRGRGNRQQGGGNQNRIDSRARGNAPQMFEKYKKLAQDAAHNGDRVQAEYYLQFADHYFRVIADNKARQDESRGSGGGRRDERDFQTEDEGEDDDFDAMRPSQSSGRYNDRPERGGERQNDGQNYRSNDRQRSQPGRDDGGRPRNEGERGYEGEEGNEFEPAENPFSRPARSRDNDRQRDDRPRDADGGGRGRGRRNQRDANETLPPVDDAGEIDAAALPPSISSSADAGEPDESPKRKLPPRRRRPAAGDAADDGETLKAVG